MDGRTYNTAHREREVSMGLLVRPDLARRGFDFVRSRWDLVREGESYLHTRVLARAGPALERQKVEASPREAMETALRAAANLLSSFESSQAMAWASVTPENEIGAALLDLLYGSDAIRQRVQRFLERGKPRDLGSKRIAKLNATVASFLLAMSAPSRFAFVKPYAVFRPAAALLTDGTLLKADPCERVGVAAGLYGELRELWDPDANLLSDLLDVHSVLFVLGSGLYPGMSWAQVVTPRDVARMAKEREDEPGWLAPVRLATDLVRDEFVDVKAEKPLHRLDLERYAPGNRGKSFGWAVEHATKDFIRIKLGNVSAHEVSFAKDEGTWRIGKETGFSREEAERAFHARVLPRLEDLLAAAKAMVAGKEEPAFTAPKLADYRLIDGKTFQLLAAALDDGWATRHLLGVVQPKRIATIAGLLGGFVPPIEKFADYLNALREIDRLLGRIPESERPTAYGLARWSYSEGSGEVLARLVEGAGQAEEEEDADSMVSAAPAERANASTASVPITVPRRVEPTWHVLEDLVGSEGKELIALLRDRTNVVLYGPPGTGKTWLASKLAKAWREWQRPDDAVAQVTFHPSYGYEEFIEGYRPNPEHPERFELQAGILPRLAARAIAGEEEGRAYLLFIDELNRGDVARILGELITLIERDKRREEHARIRMISREPLYLPRNLFILGTMNTADKSVSQLDVAVRRRFAFQLTPPRSNVFRGPDYVESVGGIRLGKLLDCLNERLLNSCVLPDRLIGHAFLLLRTDEVEEDGSIVALSNRFRHDIIPLVEEYCFSEREKMKNILGDLVDQHGRPKESVLSDGARFVEVLKGLVEGREVRDS
jgi:hypothetical protein